MLSVAVLAHNEADAIDRALDSILAQDGLGPDDRVTVLENGSTDATARIVAARAEAEQRLRLAELPMGDKANAWSHYVFNVAPGLPDAMHVFMDGDVVMRPGSLAALRGALDDHPDALAASALPHGGRTAAAWRARILAHHGLPGNLYALRDRTVARLREEGWCLPVGFIGDDTFLMWLLKRRLDPFAPPDRAAIVPAPEAGFDYDSLPRGSLDGLAALYRRQRTYGMRDVQTKLLVDHLRAAPGRRPPRDVADLAPAARPWTPLVGPFGSPTPLKLRKALFLRSWWRARHPRPRAGRAWHET